VKILVDMNLSPEWVAFLARPGWEVRRWNEVGRPTADDPDLAAWAAQNAAQLPLRKSDISTGL